MGWGEVSVRGKDGNVTSNITIVKGFCIHNVLWEYIQRYKNHSLALIQRALPFTNLCTTALIT